MTKCPKCGAEAEPDGTVLDGKNGFICEECNYMFTASEPILENSMTIPVEYTNACGYKYRIKCPNCGSYNRLERVSVDGYTADYYCINCGYTFNWTEGIEELNYKEDVKNMKELKMHGRSELEMDSFLSKLKGALMYVGGNFENYDFSKMTAEELIEICFRNRVKLDCAIVDKDFIGLNGELL